MNQKDQFTVGRKTAITFSAGFLLMTAGALITATLTFSDLRNQVTQNSSDIVSLQKSVNDLNSDNINAKVLFGEIQQQLKSIDANILDIKQRIINGREN